MHKSWTSAEQIIAFLREQGVRAARTGFVFGPLAKRHEKRAAFVLGNGAYQTNGMLSNPSNDAEAVARALEELGFSVTSAIDLDHDETEQYFSKFENALEEADVALFYYSGHGVQVDGENYLIPIGAETAGADPLGSLIRLGGLIDRIAKKVGTRIIILDACRNNPFAGQLKEGVHRAKGLPELKAVERDQASRAGLAEIDAGPEGFLAFAAAPGQVAYEGTGEISIFTDALLKHIRTYGLEINSLMNRARASVLNSTRYRQTPWSNSSLSKNFWLSPRTSEAMRTLTYFSVVSALICTWSTTKIGFHSLHWPALWKVGSLNSLIEYPYLYVNPFEGIVFGCVIGAAIWLWGRGTWWSALVALIGTTLAWQLAIYPHLLAYAGDEVLKSELGKRLDSLTVVFVFDTLRPITDSVQSWQYNLSGTIGATGTYVGCAVTTRALRNMSMLALTIAVGTVMVWPFLLLEKYYLLQDYKLLVLFVTWQSAVAACIGYALSRYVPEADEVEPRSI